MSDRAKDPRPGETYLRCCARRCRHGRLPDLLFCGDHWPAVPVHLVLEHANAENAKVGLLRVLTPFWRLRGDFWGWDDMREPERRCDRARKAMRDAVSPLLAPPNSTHPD